MDWDNLDIEGSAQHSTPPMLHKIQTNTISDVSDKDKYKRERLNSGRWFPISLFHSYLTSKSNEEKEILTKNNSR